jgi:hypothetical protein
MFKPPEWRHAFLFANTEGSPRVLFDLCASQDYYALYQTLAYGMMSSGDIKSLRFYLKGGGSAQEPDSSHSSQRGLATKTGMSSLPAHKLPEINIGVGGRLRNGDRRSAIADAI